MTNLLRKKSLSQSEATFQKKKKFLSHQNDLRGTVVYDHKYDSVFIKGNFIIIYNYFHPFGRIHLFLL